MKDSNDRPSHSSIVKAAHDRRRDVRSNHSETRRKMGRPSSLTEDQIDDIIERISAGEFISDAAKRHGVTHSALYFRARSDPEFAKRFEQAREDHYLALAENTRLVARGVEGFSSGCVTRDALIIKTDMTLAKAFADVLADRMQHRVEHTVAPVIFPTLDQFSSAVDAEFADVPMLPDDVGG